MIKKIGILFFLPLLLIQSSCKPKDPVADDAKLVSQFVYDGLSTYYLWADEMKNKKPTVADTDPVEYFESLLNATDKDHGWSFITDDVQSLLADFAGEPKAFGFSLTFAAANEARTEYYAIIKYVFPNTPASAAGLQRKDIIGKINGNAITQENYTLLYGTDAASFTMYKLSGSSVVQDRIVTVTPKTIQTNPVLYNRIYEAGGKKIGYLFYTDFISNYNDSLYSVFSSFRQAGVTDLVLDLRYNHGGALTAASYLCSMIAPAAVVQNKSPLVIMSYNDFLNSAFDKEKVSRTNSLGVYGDKEKDPLGANLNLNKVYIIATGDSYSASELTTFCLKPYIEVVHIGENTGGKYTASWTLHPYDSDIGVYIYSPASLTTAEKAKLGNWAMQPIVAKYTNKSGADFSNPGYLVPDYPLKEGFGYIRNWTDIGDPADVYLGEALYLITGDINYKPVPPPSLSRVKALPQAGVTLHNPRDVRREAVIIDNLKQKSLPPMQNIMR